MKNPGKSIITVALASLFLLGVGFGPPSAESRTPGTRPSPARPGINIPGGRIDFTVLPEEDFPVFSAGRYQPAPTPFQDRVIAGSDDTTPQVEEAKIFPTPTPFPDRVIAGSEDSAPPSKQAETPPPTVPPTPPVSPTPEGYKTPPPTPTPQPKPWVSAGTLSRIYLPFQSELFSDPPGKLEVTVTSPDGTRTRRSVVEREGYSPRKKTLSYSLLFNAYRQVYWQLFGILFTTPTPVLPPSPSPSPTPEGYKTPPPSPTALPGYCNAPLEISRLEDMTLSRTRSIKQAGWEWIITRAVDPGNRNERYGLTLDNLNTYQPGDEYELQPVSIYAWPNQTDTIIIQQGDYATLTYDGGASVKIYPPAIFSADGVYYFIGRDGITYNDRWLCDPAGVIPTPTPSFLVLDSGDYDGDGTSDIAVFRPSSGLWALRDVTRVFFGKENDLPVSGDYTGDGTTDIAVFRDSSGLWAVRGQTRLYFGAAGDIPVPGDYNGNGICEPGIFRPSSGLWAIRDVTRVYFGRSTDRPVPGYYQGKAPKNIAVFRRSTGLWAILDTSRIYFGGNADYPVPADYSGDEQDDVAIFRPASGLWAVRGITRNYFGRANDLQAGGVFGGSPANDIGIFREATGLWAIRGVTRAYFGRSGDLPLSAPPCRPVTPSPTRTPEGYKTPTPTPSSTPSPTPEGYKTPTPSPTPSNSPTPSPSPSPTPLFNLVDEIEVGSPIWSLWADDHYLYAGTGDGSVYTWQRDPGGFSSQSRITIGDYEGEIFFGLTGYPDSSPRRLYGSGKNGVIYVWAYDSRSAEWSLRTSLSRDLSFMYSVAADDELICGANEDGRVYVWSAEDPDFSLQTMLSGQSRPVVSVSLDEYYFYSGTDEGVIYRWDRDDLPAFSRFSAPSEEGWSTEVDDYYFYVGGSSPSLAGWPKSPAPVAVIGEDPSGVVNSLSSDRRSYISGVGDEGDLYVWSNSDLTLRTTSPGSDQSLYAVFADRYRAGVSHTRYIYGGGAEGKIYLWLGERTPTPSPTSSPTPSCTPSPTASPTPSATSSPTPSLTPEGYKTPSPTPSVAPTTTATPIPTPAAFTLMTTVDAIVTKALSLWADDDHLYAGGDDGTIIIWERSGPGNFTYHTDLNKDLTEDILGLTECTVRERLYAATSNGVIQVWENGGGWGWQTTLVGGGVGQPMNSVAADEDLISGAGDDGNVYVWSASDYSSQTILEPGSGPVHSVSLEPGYLYSGGDDGLIYRWDRPGFSSLTTFSDLTGAVYGTEVDEYYFYAGGSSPALAGWLKPGYSFLAGEDPSGPVRRLSSDGRTFISGVGQEASLYAWSIADFSLQTVATVASGGLYSVFADRHDESGGNPRYIFAGSDDARIYVWWGDNPSLPVSALGGGITKAAPKTSPFPVDSSAAVPLPLATALPSASPVPVPSATPLPGPGEGAFELVGRIEVGSPVWSVYADDRYLYGGTGDGSVYFWERGPEGFYSQGSIGGYNDGNIYGLAGRHGLFQRRLYGASEDGSVYAWDFDLRSGRLALIAALDQGRSFMYSVAADRELIAGANNDGGIYVWSAADFSLQTVLDRGGGPVLSVSLDGDYIYGSGVDGTVSLWDRKTLAPADSFSASSEVVWATAVDDDNFYGGGASPALAGWSKADFSLRIGESAAAGSVAGLSSDGRGYLAGAGPDGSLYVWSLADFSLQTVSPVSSAPMNSVFADRHRPGERLPPFIFGASADGNIYVWRGSRVPTPTPTPSLAPTPTPRPSATPEGHRSPTPLPTATATPPGFHTPTPPPPPAPARTPVERSTPPPVPSPTLGLRIPDDPTPLPSPEASPASTPADFSLLAVLEGGRGWMFGVFADGDYIYGAGQDNQVHIWDRETYRKVTALTVPDSRGMLAVFADGDYIYGANDDSRVYVWERESFGLSYVLGDGRYYMESVFADSEYLYGANYDGGLYIWSRPEFNLQTRFTGPRGWLNAVYADGGRIYAGSGGIDNTVSVWDRSDLSFLRDLTGPGDDLNSVWADGDYIYGASADGNVYLWDYGNLGLTRVLTQPVNQVTSVVSRGAFIYASSLDHGLYVWDKARLMIYHVLDEIEQPLQDLYVEGDQIFAAARNGRIYVWQAPSAPKASASPVPGFPHPPVPPSRPDSGVVVGELLSVASGRDRHGGIAWKEGYLYENLEEDDILYRLDPDDGKIVDRLTGLQTSRDSGISWDPDNACWYIADPWATGISKFMESDPGQYELSVRPQGTVSGLFYDSGRQELLSANSGHNYINIWSVEPDQPLRRTGRIDVGFPQGGVAAVGDRLWAGLATEASYAPVYELDRDGVKTGRQFVLPEGRHPGDMTWDGDYLWVRTDYRHGTVKIYQVDIGEASSAKSGAAGDETSEEIASGRPPPPVRAGSGDFPRPRPTPAVFEWEPPAEPYDPNRKALSYNLLQDTYKKTYWELFGVLLTTPTPPPTPIPTATRFASPTPEGFKTPAPSEGNVVINEIYWGGALDGTDDQWIELHNYGGSQVNLEGWRLRNETADWEVNLSGRSITSNGYLVLYSGTSPDGQGNLPYSQREMSTSGDKLVLLNGETVVDEVNSFGDWFAGDNRTSMERIDPAADGSERANWADSTNPSGGYFWTPGKRNIVQVAATGSTSKFRDDLSDPGSEKSGLAVTAPSLSLWEYADWIDFASGRYFKVYEWDREEAGDRAALYDYLPNAAFVYLVTGYRPTGLYFKQNLLELVRDGSFDWGGEEHSRYIADIAESYLAVLHTGLFSEEERAEIREKFYRLAIDRRKLEGPGHYGQGIICGLNAVVGYLVGGERGSEMIDWANQLLSYDDTWTLPENSRHYQGLFVREMLRVALYSNRMTIPEAGRSGADWKRNFARQIEWIIETSPHNGFSPAHGKEYHPSHLGHFMAPLAVATTILDDEEDDSEYARLAGEAKWLLQQKFNYADTHRVGGYGENSHGYGSSQWGPYAILLNPVYLYWYLNESLAPVVPSAGSTVVYRPMLAEDSPGGVYAGILPELVTQPDRIVHRSGWEEDDLFLALDMAYPAAKSGEDRYSFANNILNLSYGAEEFLTGLTANETEGEKTRANLSDILSSYTGAELVSWENHSQLSRSVTRLEDGGRTWTREVTLHKTGDRRIEVRDHLPRRGSVYWHFSGRPFRMDNGMILDVNGTRLSVTWEGAERTAYRERSTWSEPDPENRWTYTGPDDHEIKLYRSVSGTIVTTFRGL